MKAILVIDMPNGCRNCQFNIGGDLCTARNYEDGEDGCPLKPLPEKKKASVYNIEDIMKTEVNLGNQVSAMVRLNTDKLIALGYNWCLEDIEK